MPDLKGEWSLKENNSELHHGIRSKVIQLIYTLVCNYMYMPNIRILANAVLQILRSQHCSYTKCLCPENGSNSTEIYGIGSNVNQFIYILVCNYMPNIRILAKVVLLRSWRHENHHRQIYKLLLKVVLVYQPIVFYYM